jgi:hypothetical protein
MGQTLWWASEERKGVADRLFWRVEPEASWVGGEIFPRKQVGLEGTFGPRSDRAAEKIENYFQIDSGTFDSKQRGLNLSKPNTN